MGWLKKVTKPISKVLDKIVPNEVKPYLPYLAAFAPYMMGPGAGGIFSGMGINNPMMQRALMSGAWNLGSQLSQEGSEGDFSGLSLGLAGLQGALTAPGAADKLTGMTTKGTLANQGIIGSPARMELANRGLLTQAKDVGLSGLAKGAKFLEKGVDIFGPEGVEPGLNLATLEAAALPVSQATGDLAFADAQRALRDYENEMAEYDQLSLIDNDGRRRAIRAAMEAAGHLEQTILDTLAEFELKEGGMVGMKHGGQLVKRGPGRSGYKGPELEINPEIIQEWLDMGGADGAYATPQDYYEDFYGDPFLAKGGRISKEGGGLSSVLPKGREADYRGGGVIPVGSRERADDVPARLSKNEFVMTADAVRAAGGGNINQGAKRMYNLMNNLEARV